MKFSIVTVRHIKDTCLKTSVCNQCEFIRECSMLNAFICKTQILPIFRLSDDIVDILDDNIYFKNGEMKEYYKRD